MKARVIAYYLPQFHPIPENDLWWGKGFTEWTNVAKAKPLFRGHYQPRIPADLGFYDLRLPEVREQQAQMAREAGIEGFCYYHYWFGNGKQLLERPFNEVLEKGKPEFPFCLCWANHDWTNKTWKKGKSFAKNDMIMKMNYSTEDHINHFYHLLPAFKDKRYITVEGKPLFIIYQPETFPNINKFIHLWRKMATENGLNGIYFVGHTNSTLTFRFDAQGNKHRVMPNLKSSADIFNYILSLGFDAVNSFGKRRGEMLSSGKIKTILFKIISERIGIPLTMKYDYLKTVNNYFSPEDRWENVFPTILPQWDRSPRIGSADGIYVNVTPDKFYNHIQKAISVIQHKQTEHQILLLKSWNEWAEGNYVEPDEKYGHGYLNALKEALND